MKNKQPTDKLLFSVALKIKAVSVLSGARRKHINKLVNNRALINKFLQDCCTQLRQSDIRDEIGKSN